jgi:hypothetical protein
MLIGLLTLYQSSSGVSSGVSYLLSETTSIQSSGWRVMTCMHEDAVL